MDQIDLAPDQDTLAALEAIGIGVKDWEPEIITQGDAEQVLAFYKFLSSGEWSETEEGERIYLIDQSGFDYATGKISAKEYLESPEGEKNVLP